MKVLDIYGKKDLEILTCNGIVINKIMDNFFKRFPKSYRKNYDRNLESIEIWELDEHYDGLTAGEYFSEYNILLIQRLSSIVHELMHVASCDYETRLSAFRRKKDGYLFENALIEGMTEYLSSMAHDSAPADYFFETFSVSMLSNIDGIFESYFIPNYDKFIGLFPNKRDIISLMYSLNYYSNKNIEYTCGVVSEFSDMDRLKVENSIKDVIDTLIDIQLSMKMSLYNNKRYAQKFMDLLNCEVMDTYVGEYFEDYVDYANMQVNKRILRRL